LLQIQPVKAQSRVTGKIVNNKGKCLENIHVLIYNQVNDGIKAYAITNSKGEYQIKYTSENDSVFFKTQSLSYCNQQVWISTGDVVHNISLDTDIKKVKEICVRAPGITKRGDTISYSVAVFASKKDRVIADVIDKLPGLEIGTNGRILYQGEPIQKYYIDGLDLLEGKYNLANNNLPVQAVSSVQVLENHEPVKLMRKITSTDKVSLNIKLKKDITVTGEAKLGVGVSPQLWEANITPMLFNRNQQIICSYQANNIGDDVSSDLKSLTLDDLFDRMKNDNAKKELLGIQQLSTPNLKNNRYLDNNINLLSANYLIKLDKDVQLKVNSSYLNDYQKLIGGVKSEYYLGDDTIVLEENISNRINNRFLVNDLILIKNSEKSYLKNVSNVTAYWDSQLGNVNQNLKSFKQEYENPFQTVSNKLKWITPLGKRMLEVNSLIGYNNAPQQLKVSPGVNEDLLNNGIQYNEIVQNANHSVLNLNHFLSLTNRIKRLSFSHQIGYQYQSESFDSDIQLRTGNMFASLNIEYQNEYELKKDIVYVNEEIQYNNKKLNLTLHLPLDYKNYNVYNSFSKITNKKSSFLFQPKLNIKYKLNSFWEWKNTLKIIDEIEDSGNIYSGMVLVNYRQLKKGVCQFGKTIGQSYSTGFLYKNTFQSMFANIGYRYIENTKDLIMYNKIQEDGSSLFQWRKYTNNTYSHYLFVRFSKYFSSSKTNFYLNPNYQINQQTMYLNENISLVRNENISLKVNLENKIFDWMNLGLESNYSWFRSRLDKKEKNEGTSESLQLNLTIFPSERHYISSTTEFYKNKTSENIFFDLLYQYTFKNNRTKLEISWVNIFDESTYSSNSISNYSVINNHFKVRPSQVQVNLRFSF
jgi:hypothetical protein